MSKPSETDKRYDRYARIFDNPINEHVIELGNRVLHWSFMENFAPHVARGVIKQHAEEAVREARRRDPEAARRADAAPARRRRLTPAQVAARRASRANARAASSPAPDRAPQRSRGRSR